MHTLPWVLRPRTPPPLGLTKKEKTMTDHVCMNPKHDHFDPKALDPVRRRYVEETLVLAEKVNALPSDEEKLLLVSTIIGTVGGIIMDSVQALLEGKTPDAVTDLGRGQAMLALAMEAVESSQGQHEDWHKSGDRRVDAVLEGFIEVLRHVHEGQTANILDPETDLPPEIRDRMAAGTVTTEDKQFVRDLMVSKGALPESATADDIEIQVVDDAPDSGEHYGMYL